MDSTLQITNAELAEKLKASFIAPSQQEQLAPLIPKMTEAEKAELLKLIERSHKEKDKAEVAYQKNLENLGKEYKDTLKTEDKGFRKELEGIERTETTENLKFIEAEVYSIGAPAAKNKGPKAKRHTFRNLVLVLIFLGLLAGGALYALNNLA
jgi:hypothetical protein